MQWLRDNLLIAITIVVLLIVALGSAADSFQKRQLVKQLQANLVDQMEAKEKELEDAEEAWLKIVNPIAAERDALRKKLSKSGKFRPPKDDEEAVRRWKALGYDVEVGPCR